MRQGNGNNRRELAEFSDGEVQRIMKPQLADWLFFICAFVFILSFVHCSPLCLYEDAATYFRDSGFHHPHSNRFSGAARKVFAVRWNIAAIIVIAGS